jgi:hypothetical protein
LLLAHAALAVQSLVKENPTIDEVAHLPAGVTYWQKGTFKLYALNPPLVKLVAALPVVLSRPEMDPLYLRASWTAPAPAHPSFSQDFAFVNLDRYFELFTRARLMMPLFSVVGGLVVFAWSARLYGAWGGLLSLSLWAFCPNILAHGRLVTTDIGASAIGAGATYLFWRYLQKPAWHAAAWAGLALGLAQLTKFSMLLLFGLWPALWLVRVVLTVERTAWPRHLIRALGHALVVVFVAMFTIDAGYFFEGVGKLLGRYEFACAALTRPVKPGEFRPRIGNQLLDGAWRFRINRFRGTFLGSLPVPLPEYYLRGFDEQKLEADGVPAKFFSPDAELAGKGDEIQTYPVYLDGVLRRSGWRDYYVRALAYKLPEGTLALTLLSFGVLVFCRRSRAGWADELTVLAAPAVILFAISFLTDICLGLRYILPVFPYAFIFVGKVAPWAAGQAGMRRIAAIGLIGGALGANVAAAACIHPHYLAYFNWISGGPDRAPARLIDSNLDWGQDLIGLSQWLHENAPGRKVGLAYFGQINPMILTVRDLVRRGDLDQGGATLQNTLPPMKSPTEGFDWFLPPAKPGTVAPMTGNPAPDPRIPPPAKRLEPGLYAVSATFVYGLPFRLYTNGPPTLCWGPQWNARLPFAFDYFRLLQPRARVGHSIYVYEVRPEDLDRLEAERLRPRH